MSDCAPPEPSELASSVAGRSSLHRMVRRQFDGVTLYNADCLDILPELVADAVISDPPYGMNWNANTTRFSGGDAWSVHNRGSGKKQDAVLHDDQPFDPSPWLNYPAVVLFGANHYAQRLPVGTTLVWLKKHDSGFGSFLSDAEIAWMKGGHGVYAKRDTSEQGGDRQNHGRVHPTQKSVVIMAWCLEMAKVPVGGTVCDPYMGSGTTAIACIRTGRKFIGVEKDKRHFETACERIRCELAQGVLLPPNDPSSATRPMRACACNRDAMAGFAAAHG